MLSTTVIPLNNSKFLIYRKKKMEKKRKIYSMSLQSMCECKDTSLFQAAYSIYSCYII